MVDQEVDSDECQELNAWYWYRAFRAFLILCAFLAILWYWHASNDQQVKVDKQNEVSTSIKNAIRWAEKCGGNATVEHDSDGSLGVYVINCDK